MFGHSTTDNSLKSRRCFLAAVILAVVGFLLVVIGVCMPFWYSQTDVVHAGVFQLCVWSFKECVKYDATVTYWALSISGMIALLIAMVFLCTYPIRKTVDHCKIALGICVSIFLIIGVVLILTLVILYITDYLEVNGNSSADVFQIVGFSWYLTLVGLIILVAAFVCFILHMFFMVYD